MRTQRTGAEWTKRWAWRCTGQAMFLATLVSCLIRDNWVQSHGRVLDRQNGTPIARAIVRFYGSYLPDTGIRVSTDSLGRFRVFHGVSTAAQLESLSVEAPNYPPSTFRPGGKGAHLPPVEIQLSSQAGESSRMLEFISAEE